MPAKTRTRPARQIAEVPRDERPRERLLRNGAQSLSDAELLAVVLKNGLGWGSALDLTRDLLTDTGGLAGLTVASALSLRRQGVGDVQLAALLAAVELACRMAEARMPSRQLLNRPTSIARYVVLRYAARDQAA
jgi:DNA repair protein RadC